MDPLRSDLRPAEALSGPERDARIEQLLLAGLDEYFAHRYEHAINLWTRVLFLDRQHDRARAYIDRARRAQAERQRESEAALHQAIDALRAGDVDRARALVTLALDRGASPDDAQGMLERIERLGVSRIGVESRCRPAASAFRWSSVGPAARDEARPRTSASASTALLLSLAACGVLGVAMWGLVAPEPWWSVGAPSAVAAPVAWAPEPLPVAHPSERLLARARQLAATGRLHDALAVLDRIPLGDSLRSEADRLTSDVQQRLLALTFPNRLPE